MTFARPQSGSANAPRTKLDRWSRAPRSTSRGTARGESRSAENARRQCAWTRGRRRAQVSITGARRSQARRAPGSARRGLASERCSRDGSATALHEFSMESGALPPRIVDQTKLSREASMGCASRHAQTPRGGLSGTKVPLGSSPAPRRRCRSRRRTRHGSITSRSVNRRLQPHVDSTARRSPAHRSSTQARDAPGGTRTRDSCVRRCSSPLSRRTACGAGQAPTTSGAPREASRRRTPGIKRR